MFIDATPAAHDIFQSPMELRALELPTLMPYDRGIDARCRQSCNSIGHSRMSADTLEATKLLSGVKYTINRELLRVIQADPER
jgi:hypothetical protein